MSGYEGYLQQFEELDWATKLHRDLATVKPIIDIDALIKPMRDMEVLSKPLRDLEAAMKAAFDPAPIQEALRRFDIGEQFRKALENSLGGCAQAMQETARRMAEMNAGFNVRLPEMPMLVPMNFANSIPEPSEPEPMPKRRPVFIETDDL